MEQHRDTILIDEIRRLRDELKQNLAARKESSEDVDYVVLVNLLKDQNACLALDKSNEITRRVKLERERDEALRLTQQAVEARLRVEHERDVLLKQIEMGKRVEAELRKSLDMTEKALQDANANGYSKSSARKVNSTDYFPDEFDAMWRDYIQKMENDLFESKKEIQALRRILRGNARDPNRRKLVMEDNAAQSGWERIAVFLSGGSYAGGRMDDDIEAYIKRETQKLRLQNDGLKKALCNEMDAFVKMGAAKARSDEALTRLLECQIFDACMDGPKPKGWRISELSKVAADIRATLNSNITSVVNMRNLLDVITKALEPKCRGFGTGEIPSIIAKELATTVVAALHNIPVEVVEELGVK